MGEIIARAPSDTKGLQTAAYDFKRSVEKTFVEEEVGMLEEESIMSIIRNAYKIYTEPSL